MHNMKVRSDKYADYMEDRKDMMKDMPKGMAGMMGECIPVDLYGKRVNLEKDGKDNLKKTSQDIQEFYGLEPSPNEANNGGLAGEETDMGSEDY